MRNHRITKLFGCIALSAAFMLPALCGCGGDVDEGELRSETQNTAECGALEMKEGVRSGTISLYSAASAASEESWVAATQGSYTLTAITSDGYSGISYSVAWENASSEWASGKAVSDYMTVTPDEDDARTAEAKRLQAFGEPIVITATRQDNGESATVHCDYVARCNLSSSNVFGGTFGTVAGIDKWGGTARATFQNFAIDGSTPFYLYYFFPSTVPYTVKGEPRICSINYTQVFSRAVISIRTSAYFAQAQSLYDGTITVPTANKFPVTIDNYAYVGKDTSSGSLFTSCTFTHSIGDFFTFSGEDYESLKTTNPECVKYLQWAVYEKLYPVRASSSICTFTIWVGYEYNGVVVETASFQLKTGRELDLSNLSAPPASEE